MPFILYKRDKAMKEYHFSKLGKEGWAALASDIETEEDPNLRPAMAAFYADYALPDFQVRAKVSLRARLDFQAALKRGQVPGWALLAVSLKEMEVDDRELGG